MTDKISYRRIRPRRDQRDPQKPLHSDGVLNDKAEGVKRWMARRKGREKNLLAKIGDLAMHMDVIQPAVYGVDDFPELEFLEILDVAGMEHNHPVRDDCNGEGFRSK